MGVNEAWRGEDMQNVERGETVRQVVNMARLGWEPSNACPATRAALNRGKRPRPPSCLPRSFLSVSQTGVMDAPVAFQAVVGPYHIRTISEACSLLTTA
jgi:hypothetical protein